MADTFFQVWEAAERSGDVCANRHGGNPKSEEAFAKIVAELPKRRAEVLVYVRREGRATTKTFARYMGHPEAVNRYSGRFAELKRDGLIRENGETLEGYAVVVPVTF